MKMQIRELDDNSILLCGYANVCRTDSKILTEKGSKEQFIEQIMNGAFARSLRLNPSIPMLFNHDFTRVLGKNGEDECEFMEDNVGLRYQIRVTDEEVIRLAKSGKLQGLSFGFQPIKEKVEKLANGLKRRLVSELKLFEISLLSKEPAYFANSIEMRDSEGETMELRFSPMEMESLVEEKINSEESTVSYNVETKEDEGVSYIEYTKEIKVRVTVEVEAPAKEVTVYETERAGCKPKDEETRVENEEELDKAILDKKIEEVQEGKLEGKIDEAIALDVAEEKQDFAEDKVEAELVGNLNSDEDFKKKLRLFLDIQKSKM